MRNDLALAVCVCCLVCGPAAVYAQEREKAVSPPPAGAPAVNGLKMLEPGTIAPDFSIKDPEGNSFRLLDARGKKPVLLVFWSVFCEPCRLELKVLQKMHVQHKEAGLEVVGVSLDGEPLKSSVRGFVKQEGYTFMVLIDELDSREAFKAADPYGVAGMPTVYLVDRTGRIALARAGRIKQEELEKAVQAVLK